MESKNFLEEVRRYNINIRTDEKLAGYTTLNIGGPAKYFAFVNTVEELFNLLKLAREFNLKVLVIGAGSNLLISDKGFDGLVIKLKSEFNNVFINKTDVISGSGVMLPMLIKLTVDYSLCGLEELFGIPGSVGGGIIMNAGTKIASISDNLLYIEAIKLDELDLGIIRLNKNEINFGYRRSGLEDRFVILKSVFSLKEGDKIKLQQRITEVLLKRKETQPLGTFNAGCVFKNPDDGKISSAMLIEQCGLKGYSCGGAYISEKHANFIINKNNATCEDFLNLMRYVIKTVKERFNITIEPEIKLVGVEL